MARDDLRFVSYLDLSLTSHSLTSHVGILTVGVVTFPFSFEGRRRSNQATNGAESLRQVCYHFGYVTKIMVFARKKHIQTKPPMGLRDCFRCAFVCLFVLCLGYNEVVSGHCCDI